MRKILVYGNPEPKEHSQMNKYLMNKLKQGMICDYYRSSFQNIEEIRETFKEGNGLMGILEKIMQEKQINREITLFTATIKNDDAVELITLEAEKQGMEAKTYIG